MFKVCVQASSFEELKAQLEPMFKMMDKFSAPAVPTAEDLGYSEDGDESSEPISSSPSPVVTAPVTLSTPSVPPVVAMPPVAASPVDNGSDSDDDGSDTSNSQGPDRDSRGIPWDNRIHAANRALKKDGTWKYRRGVDETVIAEVEKGLTAPATPVAVPTFPNAAPVPAIPTLPPAFPVAQPVASEPTPSLAPTATAPAQAPVAPVETAVAPVPVRPAHTPQSFQANLPMVINTLIAQKKVDRPWLVNIAQHFGVQEWWDIAKYDDKSRQLFDACVQWGFITNVG